MNHHGWYGSSTLAATGSWSRPHSSHDLTLTRLCAYLYLTFGSGAAADLPWSTRSGICLGTAKGLSYLHEEHEPNVVHRDIKASNVLLDRDYLPKIGDFGLAKLFPDNITHISTGVVGTR